MLNASAALWYAALAAVMFSSGWVVSNSRASITLALSSLRRDDSHSGAAADVSAYQLAYQESLGFFDDINEQEWNMLKDKVQNVQPNTCKNCGGGDARGAWFQNNYEPDFACRHEYRIGSQGDGGKWVCDPHRLADSCLVYSVGSRNDFSFETAIKNKIGPHCEVHTFDMADYSQGARRVGSFYHQWGIAKMEHVDRKGQRFKTLQQTIEELGHANRTVDIFKIDCEGCELDSVESWFDASVTLRQILVEIHDVGSRAHDFFEAMYRNGYVIFHKEPNIQYWRRSLGCVEYAFLKLDTAFFGKMQSRKNQLALACHSIHGLCDG